MNLKKTALIAVCLLAVVAVLSAGCVSSPDASTLPRETITLSSTIGPVDAGMVPALEDAYMEKHPNVVIRHYKAGTGATIDMAKSGIIDLVIVHAKALEEQFVADGYGTERIPLMYNDFVIMGPADDPAGIKGMTDATAAIKKIAEKNIHFISRGDMSGTHVKELDVWKAAGITPEGNKWYEVYEKGATGNGPTLMYTDEQKAYTIMDRATYLTKKASLKNIGILVEGDEVLLNFINLIPCNPETLTKVDYDGAMAFVEWLVSDEAQEIIKNFGLEQYGEPLFFPNANSAVF